MNNLITIHNLETNEVIVREMTDKELEQREKDTVEFAAFLQAKADKKAKREALLNRLGINDEEARLLLG